MIHYLRIDPVYFDEIKSGQKKFEVRYKDRDYKVGDYLLLCEYAHGKYTERGLFVEVTYILDNADFCKDNFVIMSISLITVAE